MAAPPLWAKRMVTSIWAERSGIDTREVPVLTWRKSKIHEWSSGSCDWVQNRVTVSAGSNRVNQKLTLIHEMAHLIDPPVNTPLFPRKSHDAIFYFRFWELIRRYKLPLREAMRQELTYRTLSVIIAGVVGIRGAKKIHTEYQNQLAHRRRERKKWERVLTQKSE